MSYLREIVVFSLFLNAVVAFAIAFFWHARVIFKVLWHSNWLTRNSVVPWGALADQNSPKNQFGRFWAGELYPDLRRKWGRAVSYLVMSFLVLFVVAGLIEIIEPGYSLTSERAEPQDRP